MTAVMWRFSVDDLPPSGNHQYKPRRNRAGEQVGWKLTQQARDDRASFTTAARTAGFTPSPDRYYIVRVRFTVSDIRTDLDNRIKTLNDAIFGSDLDYRVMQLLAEKVVVRGVRRTEVEIEDITDDELMAQGQAVPLRRTERMRA